MRKLPAALKREISDFSFAYRIQVPDLLAPSPDQELRSFEDELAAFCALDAETISLEFSRPLWDHEGRRDTAHLERPEVREHIAVMAGRYGADPTLTALVHDDPLRLARRFADLVSAYWDAAFAEEWERLEPVLADTVTEAGRRMASDSRRSSGSRRPVSRSTCGS